MKTHTTTSTREEVVANGAILPLGCNEMYLENVGADDASYTIKDSAAIIPLSQGENVRIEGQGNSPGKILVTELTISFAAAGGDKKVLVTRIFKTALTV